MGEETLREIHRYWFGEIVAPDDYHEPSMRRWFERSAATDEDIRARFGGFLAEAAKREWEVGRLSAAEGVALVVLFDQFPRNLFRNSPQAFAHDAQARNIARQLVATGVDRHAFVERAALTLPFEHSEDAGDQDFAVWLGAGLALAAPGNLREFARGQLDYVTRHRDVIRKFGRFPHRNAVLGRESTPEETAFPAAGGGF